LHLDDKTGGHSFVSELSSFEVRTGSTRRSGVLHVSSLDAIASEMLSKSAGEGLSIDDASSYAVKFSSSDVTSESLTTAGEPIRV